MDHVLCQGTSTEVIATLDPAGAIEPIIGIGVPLCPNHAWSKHGLLAYPVRDGRAVQVWSVDGSIRRVASLTTPILVRDVIWCGEQLIIGGLDEAGARVWARDFGAVTPDWLPLDVPVELLRWRKGVDALARSADTLVAIDNIVIPKWAAIYDVAGPGPPSLSGCWELPPNGPYEHIVAASSGATAFAVYSTTAGRTGFHKHLSVYRFGACTAVGRIVVGNDVVAFAMDGDELITFSAEVSMLRRYSLESLSDSTLASVDIQAPEGFTQLRRTQRGRLILTQDTAPAWSAHLL